MAHWLNRADTDGSLELRPIAKWGIADEILKSGLKSPFQFCLSRTTTKGLFSPFLFPYIYDTKSVWHSLKSSWKGQYSPCCWSVHKFCSLLVIWDFIHPVREYFGRSININWVWCLFIPLSSGSGRWLCMHDPFYPKEGKLNELPGVLRRWLVPGFSGWEGTRSPWGPRLPCNFFINPLFNLITSHTLVPVHSLWLSFLDFLNTLSCFIIQLQSY